VTTTWLSSAAAFALAASASCACAQAPSAAPDRVPARIDESRVATLYGNTHPLARPEFESGLVASSLQLDRMVLLLKPSASRQKALDALVAAQQDPASRLYHHWLTPADYGAQFGASPRDLARITNWLRTHGFVVNEIPAARRTIVFSGTVAQVAETFHTEIRRYRFHAAQHIANVLDPQIPLALSGVVGGVVSLHDFRRMPAMHAFAARPLWNFGSAHYLFPADFAAIYNLVPLYAANINGAGATIAIAGRSSINIADVAAFRSAAALAPATPRVMMPGDDPGLVNGDQDESTLDVEWAGAIAPAAAITLVTESSTATTDGIDLAAAYIVDHAAAQVLSVSYGSCEQAMGTTEQAFYDSLWEQAASEGISVFVASGDSGAAGCELGSASVGSVAAVNGLCSSSYATCVGGTELHEGPQAAQYWSTANGAGRGSALGYIPETVWNESLSNGGAGLWASGGGPSTVYAQPSWQIGVPGAAPANGMRAVPDVALTAAAHDGYIIYENGSYWIVSGTSAGAPSFAGITALIVQKGGESAQGNINRRLYEQAGVSPNPFHRTFAGDNTVPGVQGFSADGADFNLATGLGSVDANLLVTNWGHTRQQVPSRATPIPVSIARRQ
jgi:subtilase family serine protease